MNCDLFDIPSLCHLKNYLQIKKTSSLFDGLAHENPAEPDIRVSETRLLFTLLTQYLLCSLPQEAWDEEESKRIVTANSLSASFHKSAWGVLALMLELCQDLFDRARYALKSSPLEDVATDQVLSYLADPAISNLLNIVFLTFCLTSQTGSAIHISILSFCYVLLRHLV